MCRLLERVRVLFCVTLHFVTVSVVPSKGFMYTYIIYILYLYHLIILFYMYTVIYVIYSIHIQPDFLGSRRYIGAEHEGLEIAKEGRMIS